MKNQTWRNKTIRQTTTSRKLTQSGLIIAASPLIMGVLLSASSDMT
jgi:hypothetical protein